MAAYAKKRFHNDVINTNLRQKIGLLHTKISIIGTVATCHDQRLIHPILDSARREPDNKAVEKPITSAATAADELVSNPYVEETSHNALLMRSRDTTYKTVDNSRFVLPPEKKKKTGEGKMM